MIKLLLSESDISKNNVDQYFIIDKWYESFFSKEKIRNLNIKYLNEFNFSIESEQKEVNEVDKIYEELLIELSEQLNKIHDLRWGLKSWRIFLGPWLNRFVAIIYDRTKILLPILDNNIDCKKQMEIGSSIPLISFDMKDFTDKTLKKKWNDDLFCRIIYILKSNNFSNTKNLENSSKINYKLKGIKKFKYSYIIKLISFLRFLFFPIVKKNKFVFYKPYFGEIKNIFKFILSLNDIPIKYSFGFFDSLRVYKNFNIDFRNKLNLKIKDSNIREKITRLLIKECLPTIYLEGFDELKNLSRKSFLPSKKKVIVTFNSWRDNIFKFWLADQINSGSKLIYGQHGAGYGTNLKHYAEKHELEICDMYLTWGWRKANKKNIPIGDLSTFDKKDFQYINNKKILIAAGNINIFKFNNLIHDKNDLILKKKQINSFLDSVDSQKIKILDLKEHPNDTRRDCSLYKIIETKNVKINLIKSRLSFEKLINNYELLVFPYQFATPFLKFLSLNKPCISIFDDKYLEPDLKKDFYPLYDNGILHHSAENMASFVNQNFDDFFKWWNNGKTQEARKTFCQKYIKRNINFPDLIHKLKKIEKSLYK